MIENIKEFNIDHWAREWFLSQGISEQLTPYLTFAVDLLLVLLLSFVVDFIARKIILRLVSRYVKRSPNEYDDVFLDKKVFTGLAHLLPAIIIYLFIPYLFEGTLISTAVVKDILVVYMIFVVIRVGHRFFKALEHIGLHSQRLQGKPISSYIQVGIIAIYVIGGVFILSMVVGKSPGAILTTFGAATAVILLIFRDTILGFVASIQIAGNDMVRLGDWITMNKYGADGDVIEINLTTVKIRNFDKTITTVPTYSFIADSFQNWRGMQETGIRRIKRSIYLDLNTVQMVSPDMYEKYLRYERVAEYVKKCQQEIEAGNKEKNVDKSELLNGRNMTNLGVFREYAHNFLIEHPRVDSDTIVMVRQLQPTENGVPVEIYCFCKDTAWVDYEKVQNELMDHLLVAVSRFDLKIFQEPSGKDLQKLIRHLPSPDAPSS